MKSVHINDIKSNLNSINLIDIRESIELLSLPKLAQATHIPMSELLQAPEDFLNKEISYYLICRSGARTFRVTEYLEHLGYDVINVEGGMLEYYSTINVQNYFQLISSYKIPMQKEKTLTQILV